MARRHVSRREFLQQVTLASGAVALTALPISVGHAGQSGEPKIGAQLIGKLEGPELVLDPAKWPKKFGEAPMLAELVKAGKLPPVEKRIPEEPMVVKPLHSIGKYGGTWRRGFTGPGDAENGNRIVSTDKILFWDYTGTKIMPCLARDWRLSDDGKVCTIFLRKGHKWSDGHPFTADDFVFWYEDVYLNKDLQPTPHPDFMVNGKPGPSASGTSTRWCSSFPSRTTSSWTSWPAARPWAVGRQPSNIPVARWAPTCPPTTSSSSCPSTRRGTRWTGRPRRRASTAG